jgi:serine/threonine protein kinase
MVGRTLGHYLIVERIGAGGMGVVYRAQDTQLARAVALKVVGGGAQVDEKARARLLREARTARP